MIKQTWTIGGGYGTPSIKIIKSNKKEITAEELLDILEKGGTITVSNPVEATAVVNTVSTIKLDGGSIVGKVFAESNGEILEGNSDSYAIWVKDGGNLTIEGDGEIVAQEAIYSMAVWANGGDVIIKGGKFYNHGEGSDLIYASAGGNVYIYGGEFHANEKQEGVEGTLDKVTALNIKDADRNISEIKVYGGKFYGFNPANNASEGPGTNFVAEGYKSVEVEEGVWEVVKE